LRINISTTEQTTAIEHIPRCTECILVFVKEISSEVGFEWLFRLYCSTQQRSTWKSIPVLWIHSCQMWA